MKNTLNCQKALKCYTHKNGTPMVAIWKNPENEHCFQVPDESKWELYHNHLPGYCFNDSDCFVKYCSFYVAKAQDVIVDFPNGNFQNYFLVVYGEKSLTAKKADEKGLMEMIFHLK